MKQAHKNTLLLIFIVIIIIIIIILVSLLLLLFIVDFFLGHPVYVLDMTYKIKTTMDGNFKNEHKHIPVSPSPLFKGENKHLDWSKVNH